MKYQVILQMLFLFFVYSFFGWVLETIAVAVKEKRFVNRGITNGPLCSIYGVGALILSVTLNDVDNIIFLFLGSLIYTSVLEFLTGKLLEKFNRSKWWDYSNKLLNVDGYICLSYSVLWGVLGVLATKVLTPFLTFIFYKTYNVYITSIILIFLTIVFILDFITSFITIESGKVIETMTDSFGNWILKMVDKRLNQAYPTRKKKVKKSFSDKEINFCNIFLIFLIGSFIGDLIEIVFCRYSMGRWMSRSSVLWGQFSLVWGLALVMIIVVFHRHKDRAWWVLFLLGSLLGGAYEYICSVFTEFFFGTIFWDYSKLPFNLNGRINLLFCLFWGLATVVFIKGVYPYLLKLVNKIPIKLKSVLTYVLVLLMSIDLLVTGCAMMRYNARNNNIPATNIVEKLCDKYFNDDFMKKRWSNMKRPKKKQQLSTNLKNIL